MSEVTVAATQMACSWNIDENIEKAEELVRLAHEDGAQIILLQELFQTPYFCLEQTIDHLDLAASLCEDRAIRHFRTVAKELGVVLPISYYEKAGPAQYNSLAIIDADGEILWNYRKSHIPQAPGYEEKFYFSPGDTGFRAVDTRYARIGCGICWDQWFPETARALALQGAELLFFPTAIGSEQNVEIDSSGHWRRTMQGHAAANMIPVIASNRVGREAAGNSEALFYGTSFIADQTGAIVAEASRTDETYLTARFDLDAVRAFRRSWGIYRDRRPDLYGAIRTLDGQTAIG
ncbi:N-carbamoylputrescine amidase [Ensifer sp. ZNC0028]|uniref:N-carbamoylputrescine amidase n=1 Tax=Ensifer sp. ZNC0028 TaxID=1339236 RepID=UPI0005BCABDB|nr:N-carbamoylputrescine amidase [Ensifer sp. ZNC0028]